MLTLLAVSILAVNRDLTTKQSTRSRVITNQQPEVAGQFQYATILVKTESMIHEVTQNLAKKALVSRRFIWLRGSCHCHQNKELPN